MEQAFCSKPRHVPLHRFVVVPYRNHNLLRDGNKMYKNNYDDKRRKSCTTHRKPEGSLCSLKVPFKLQANTGNDGHSITPLPADAIDSVIVTVECCVLVYIHFFCKYLFN